MPRPSSLFPSPLVSWNRTVRRERPQVRLLVKNANRAIYRVWSRGQVREFHLIQGGLQPLRLATRRRPGSR